MNDAIFSFLYGLSHQYGFLDRLIVFFAHYFPFCVIFFAAVFLALHHEVLWHEHPFRALKQKWREIAMVFAAGAAAWVLAHLLKELFYTSRPLGLVSDLQPLFAKTGHAFPSGHAAFFSALAFAIFGSHRRAGYVFLIFALLISLARVAAGVHYPIDILGGFALGAIVVYLFAYFTKSR